MARRTDPIDIMIEFFETTTIDRAQAMLTAAKGIVKRRERNLAASEAPTRRLRATVATPAEPKGAEGLPGVLDSEDDGR